MLRSLGIRHAHVAGFSMGGTIAQELAIRHPDLVGSLVLSGTWTAPRRLLPSHAHGWMFGARHATSEREFLETFFLWIYNREWHDDGTVDRLIDETLESRSPRTRTGSSRRCRRASTGKAPRRASAA